MELSGCSSSLRSSSYFSGIPIVDEAGQIGLPDLLVPLVRARRAMLVGDHQQLPPFVASEVQTWLDSLSPQDQLALNLDDEMDAEQVTELLTRSAFELLFTRRPDSEHVVRFIEQRRMPAMIADFVSEHFYDRSLRTAGRENGSTPPHRDPLFQVPMVFIDTSDLPLTQRRDKTPRALRGDQDPEGWGQSGYYNELEARLIADLVDVYQQANSDWVVIAPYQAQVRHILDLLKKRIVTDEFKLEERVATVDAFQGGERDVVLYGFTRSNPRGSIGFLKELRRLNVAITRAKQQLVLVGDLSTLTQANDDAFRHLASELERYVTQNNGLLSYDACRKLLPLRSR
jgi:superfamily I DNA and/or RNA helicase